MHLTAHTGLHVTWAGHVVRQNVHSHSDGRARNVRIRRLERHENDFAEADLLQTKAECALRNEQSYKDDVNPLLDTRKVS